MKATLLVIAAIAIILRLAGVATTIAAAQIGCAFVLLALLIHFIRQAATPGTSPTATPPPPPQQQE